MPTFYRVVKTDPPKETDFLSHQARGVVLRRDTPYYRRLAEGVLVSSTLEAARSLARRFPAMGRFVAILDIAEGGVVTFEQTTEVSTHYTLWGEPRDILERVVSVAPL